MGIVGSFTKAEFCSRMLIVTTMNLLSKIFSNTRKPEGFFGKMMVNGMNGGGHAAMANWALSSLQINEDSRILDIG